MNELDRMLQAPGETVLPPLVRDCKKRKESGDRIEVELHRRGCLCGTDDNEKQDCEGFRHHHGPPL